MKTKIISLVVLAVVLIGASLVIDQFKSRPTAILNASSDQYARTTVKVGSKTFAAELAVTQDQQELGLGHRESLSQDAGMLFVFKPAEEARFWMKDMRFNLDIIWIADGRVVDITRDAPIPKAGTAASDLPNYSPGQLVNYVLEVNSGAANGVKAGDSVEINNSLSV